MGICFSCVRRKDEGTTRNVMTGDLYAETETSIKLCVSVPVGNVCRPLIIYSTWRTAMTTTAHKCREEIEAFGKEIDGIRQRVVADLGERDADYIRNIVSIQKKLEIAGRGLLFVGFLPPA